MSLMKGHPCAGYIYKPSFLICNHLIILFILIQLLFNIFTILNGLLRTVLFILDIYIVNQLGSPQVKGSGGAACLTCDSLQDRVSVLTSNKHTKLTWIRI
jgi:hypothetical protein